MKILGAKGLGLMVVVTILLTVGSLVEINQTASLHHSSTTKGWPYGYYQPSYESCPNLPHPAGVAVPACVQYGPIPSHIYYPELVEDFVAWAVAIAIVITLVRTSRRLF